MRKLPLKNGEVIAPSGKLEPKVATDARGVPLIYQERKYELMTPLFGGGVEPGVNDAITPIAVKEIRGHLRFWWRATRGGQFGGGDEGLIRMKKREAEIWGATSTTKTPSPSQVQLRVYDVSHIGTENPYKAKGKASEGWEVLSYAAFPLQETPHSSVRTGVKFTLEISYPETIIDECGQGLPIQKDIDAALWAWETFGGIGARTRRGFGAIRTNQALRADPEKIEQWIRGQLEEFVANGEFPDGVPHLNHHMPLALATAKKDVLVGKAKELRRVAHETYRDAWEALIGELKRFRQARDNGAYGRSKWNEPEQVRRISKKRSSRHVENPDLLGIEKFPRGEFGLPILFHFKDEDTGDPPDMLLKGGLIPDKEKYRERLASPLILRPLACGEKKAVGLAAILMTARQPPEGLVLKGEGIEESVEMKLVRRDALKIEPLKNLAQGLEHDDAEVDILEAFLGCFSTQEKKKK